MTCDMPRMRAPVFLVWAFAAALVCSREPRSDYHYSNIVKTCNGYVQGRTENITVKDGGYVKVDIFQGIPYARPPVGELRFRRPIPADPWTGTLQATTPPNSCIQVPVESIVSNASPPPRFSEDCLYLNIWRPRIGGQGKLTTMMWIHGGGFIGGASTQPLYDGSKLAANEGVIVASMNYRLSALGFLFMNTEDAPGNMGMLDIAMTLKWLRDNIAKFGGDPASITIFGQSAGGTAVSSFLVSPRTRDHFKNAIVQSGTAFVSLTYQSQESASAAASEVARRVNCSSDNRTTQVACLRRVNATDLVTELFFSGLSMTTVNDGYFLTRDPIISFQTGDFKRCDIMTGTTKDEGSFFLTIFRPDLYNYANLKPLVNLTDQEVTQTLALGLSLVLKPEFIPDIIVKTLELYDYQRLKAEEINPSFSFLKPLFADLVFACPGRLLATFYAQAKQKSYLYLMEYVRDITTVADWVGATHGAEVPFVFGTTIPIWPAFTPREVKLQRDIMSLWANFAKSGNPTPGARDTPRWPTYSPPDPGNILLFTESAEVRVGLTESTRCAYWNSLPREYYRN